MAKVHITFHSAMGGGAPISGCRPHSAETIVSSGTSQATTISASVGDFISVTALSDVYSAIGTAPVAASGSGDLVPAGATKTFGPASAGFKVAIIDA